MSRLPRRLALTVLLLGGLALALAPPPAQARELAPPGWLDALAHQLAQWTAGWSSPPATCAAARQSRSHPAKGPRPPITIECGGPVDPDGHCLSLPAPPQH
jgi:hypothetical protein